MDNHETNILYEYPVLFNITNRFYTDNFNREFETLNNAVNIFNIPYFPETPKRKSICKLERFHINTEYI